MSETVTHEVLDDGATLPGFVIRQDTITNNTGAAWIGLNWSVDGAGAAWLDTVHTSPLFAVCGNVFGSQEFSDRYGFGDPGRATDLQQVQS